MPPLSAAALRDFAHMSVDFLVEAIAQDCYPDESVEGIFGIKMGDALGAIVYNAWITLIKYTGVATHEDMVSALVAGSMPQYFETLVRANADKSFYTQALVSRDLFGTISWDVELLEHIAGN